MSSYIDIPFPDAVARGATGGPKFMTSVVTVASGREYRNICWAQRRAEYNISTGIRTRTEMAAVIAHFHNVYGRAYSFPFKDWSDFSVSDCETVAVGTLVFQLVKRYTLGTQTYVRTIAKPVSGTVSLTVSGETVTPASIDCLTGQVTFAATPADVPHASFEFYVPVRFDSDQLPIQVDAYNKQTVSQINLIEVKDE